jgi:hypothetical protein
MASATIKFESPTWFRAWANQWRRDTAHLSSQSSRQRHPSYRQIVELGWTAVPLLIEELRDRPDFWFSALREITGEDPVQDHIRGNYDEMRDAWLSWAAARGVIAGDGRAIPEQNGL